MSESWKAALAVYCLVSLVFGAIAATPQPAHHDIQLFASSHDASEILSRRSERLKRRSSYLEKRQSLIPEAVLVNDAMDTLYRAVITIGTPPQVCLAFDTLANLVISLMLL